MEGEKRREKEERIGRVSWGSPDSWLASCLWAYGRVISLRHLRRMSIHPIRSDGSFLC